MRKGESEQVTDTFRRTMGIELIHVDAGDRFFARLAGVTEPEAKRKAIGDEFIRVFEEHTGGLVEAEFLVQGTLYPDLIESGGHDGTAAVIKSHHNVGGLPEDMRLELVEPLRELFKDEVRRLGHELGLPDAMVWRQPFPGPGLGVRIIGEVTPERVALLQEADAIVREEIAAAGLEREHLAGVRRPRRHPLGRGHGRRADLRPPDHRPGRHQRRRDDRRLGPPARTTSWSGCPTASSTRSRGSTGSSTTSRRSRPARSSGSDVASVTSVPFGSMMEPFVHYSALHDGTHGSAVADWKQTACILCECNCGIEVRLGGDDGRRFERIRGDKAHPASQGYTCEKALRLDHYQNGRAERVLRPLRRRADGTFEEIDWETAIAEVAARLAGGRATTHGGEKILYYGGGGQGNHLGGAYSGATLRAFGARYRSNALAQEKTGEFWVNGRMLGSIVRADFEHAEVALFVGKNPWMSHSFPRARTTLKEIARDPERAMIVIDPRRTETAELADFHLQVKPGRDAWLVGAMAAILVDEGLVDRAWLAEHATGFDEVVRRTARASRSPSGATISGVDEAARAGRRASPRRRRAASPCSRTSAIQMNRHSTLVSYLEKLRVAAHRQLRQARRPVHARRRSSALARAAASGG